MDKKKELRWVSREVAPVNRGRLKLLGRGLAPMAEASFGDTALATHELPDLSEFPSPKDKAIRLLQTAAAVEHSLLVQYLYAGYSFAQANRDILNIAIEEMSHLMTVQNLLKLIGAEPDLSRQDFGAPSDDQVRLFPFNLMLEPVTNTSLAKYVLAESPENATATVPASLMTRIVDLATAGAGTAVNRVGTLYALIGAVFGSEQLLLQRAATGDAWAIAVNALATEAAAYYGGRDKLHLPDSAFVPSSLPQQGSDRDWDRAAKRSDGLDHFRVHTVTSRDEALDALRDIGLQGEGPSLVPSEASHFQQFVGLFKKFYGEDGTGAGPATGVLPVPSAARIAVDDASADPQAISHPSTVRWARLADQRYAIMLGALELYLKQPVNDRSFLLAWCFAEMFVLKKLASYLASKPRSSAATSPPAVAALPFNLPPWSGTAVTWAHLEIAFQTATIETTAILTGTGLTEAQKRVLTHMATSDGRKLSEVQARKAGTPSTRNTFDRAREIFDWLVAAGDPHHDGSSNDFPNQDQGRFWNQSLASFKSTEVFGENIVAPVPGGEPVIIRELRGNMPRNRPKLATTDEEFLFLQQWIQAGCPENPV